MEVIEPKELGLGEEEGGVVEFGEGLGEEDVSCRGGPCTAHTSAS